MLISAHNTVRLPNKERSNMNSKIRNITIAASLIFGAGSMTAFTAAPASAKTVVLTYPNSDGSNTYGAAVVRGGSTVGYGEGSTKHEAKKNARKDAKTSGVVASPECDGVMVLC